MGPPRSLPVEHLVHGLRRPCHRSPLQCVKLNRAAAQRTFSSTPITSHNDLSPSEELGRYYHSLKSDVAVIGGGISGLVAALELARMIPKGTITLYESSDRLGGWVKTETEDVGSGKIVFEQGPRSLRPNTTTGLLTLQLIHHLKLEDEIIAMSKTSPAAQSRYIYYPDQLTRVPLPTRPLDMLSRMTSEPAFAGVLSGLLTEWWRPPRSRNVYDESIHSFISRRIDPRVADNLVSAMLHGIYAGDVRQLSARALMPALYYAEEAHGSWTRALWRGIAQPKLIGEDEYSARIAVRGNPLFEAGFGLKGASLYTFRNGLATLTEGLEARLRKTRNARILLGRGVTKIKRNEATGGVTVTTSPRHPPTEHTHAVAAVPAPALAAISSSPLPTLATQHAVTVMVVNLHFPNPDVLPVHGFGYLIPRSVSLAQNPERALGVVFDTDATMGRQDSVPGTKVTVMLGGHWWDDFDGAYPDTDEGAAMATAVLRRHLGIEATPGQITVGLQRRCIPQYTVGHAGRMQAAHRALLDGYRGTVVVAGNSYSGVGVNDCVAAGNRAAKSVVANAMEAMGARTGGGRETGLKSFTSFPDWTWYEIVPPEEKGGDEGYRVHIPAG